ncbi:hypothetical protein VTL71DRAFT_1414 [Oculimacula yallundae]|uniref:Uncharacterized protein n=1 Tax=Oculimacula yallundae TaxID=86028 RepID=A0ABR4CAM9_9HELO
MDQDDQESKSGMAGNQESEASMASNEESAASKAALNASIKKMEFDINLIPTKIFWDKLEMDGLKHDRAKLASEAVEIKLGIAWYNIQIAVAEDFLDCARNTPKNFKIICALLNTQLLVDFVPFLKNHDTFLREAKSFVMDARKSMSKADEENSSPKKKSSLPRIPQENGSEQYSASPDLDTLHLDTSIRLRELNVQHAPVRQELLRQRSLWIDRVARNERLIAARDSVKSTYAGLEEQIDRLDPNSAAGVLFRKTQNFFILIMETRPQVLCAVDKYGNLSWGSTVRITPANIFRNLRVHLPFFLERTVNCQKWRNVDIQEMVKEVHRDPRFRDKPFHFWALKLDEPHEVRCLNFIVAEVVRELMETWTSVVEEIKSAEAA